jgi:serine/threonine protein kinase
VTYSVSNDPRPPDCPYDFLGQIGSGGCAVVYRAIRLDRPTIAAAVKVQKPGPFGTARFRREIDIARRLDHPHVMPLIDASRVDAWYAMPLADGTLRRLHDRNPYDWEGLRTILGGVCGALLHAHANGIIHRDISPDNILQLPGHHWVLSDFGLARCERSAASITPPGALFGTPGFDAPEVHHDPRQASSASDAYSLGAIARWFTKISREQNATSERGKYWSELIRETTDYQPGRRWSIARIARHLEFAPATERVYNGGKELEACARCGGQDRQNGAGRCVRCGFLDAK